MSLYWASWGRCVSVSGVTFFTPKTKITKVIFFFFNNFPPKNISHLNSVEVINQTNEGLPQIFKLYQSTSCLCVYFQRKKRFLSRVLEQLRSPQILFLIYIFSKKNKNKIPLRCCFAQPLAAAIFIPASQETESGASTAQLPVCVSSVYSAGKRRAVRPEAPLPCMQGAP